MGWMEERSGPSYFCGRLMQLRSQQYVMDVSVTFVCDLWWLTEHLCYFSV